MLLCSIEALREKKTTINSCGISTSVWVYVCTWCQQKRACLRSYLAVGVYRHTHTHASAMHTCTHRCVLAWRLRFYSPWHFDCFSMLSGCSEKWLSDFLILNSIGIWMRFLISAFISIRNICVFQHLAIISFFVDSNMFGSNLISCNCGARHFTAGFRCQLVLSAIAVFVCVYRANDYCVCRKCKLNRLDMRLKASI